MAGTNSSQDNHAGNRDAGSAEESGAASRPGRADNIGALRRVIAESLSNATDRPDLESAELKPLLDVARRHQGSSFTFEPVAAELVEAAIVNFFAPNGGSAAAPWRAVSKRVAESLFADPYSHKRLERLWQRLNEAVS